MKQYPTNPTCVMSLKCTKEFEMLENNENRGKRKCDFIHKPTFLHYKGKRYAYQEFINCTKQYTWVTATSQKVKC